MFVLWWATKGHSELQPPPDFAVKLAKRCKGEQPLSIQKAHPTPKEFSDEGESSPNRR